MHYLSVHNERTKLRLIIGFFLKSHQSVRPGGLRKRNLSLLRAVYIYIEICLLYILVRIIPR